MTGLFYFNYSKSREQREIWRERLKNYRITHLQMKNTPFLFLLEVAELRYFKKGS